MSDLEIGIGPFPLERTRGASLERVYARALALAEEAERAGLDGVWVDGNHFTPEAHGPSPLLFAAALAARTRRVTIGVATQTLSLGEHPLLVAEEALFLDALSAGRLVLGVGLGYREEELVGFGVARSARRTRFDDALALLRAAFARPAELPFEGELLRVNARVSPEPGPVRPGGPPIWIGGGWSPAAVRSIARSGLPLISQFFESAQRIARKLAHYRQAAPPAAPGRWTVPAIRDVAVGAPDALLPALVRVYRRYAAWGMPLLERPTQPEEIGPDEVRRIAWVGEPGQIAQRLAELREAGVSHLLARVDLPGIPPSVALRTLRTLARLRSGAPVPARSSAGGRARAGWS